MPVVNREDFLSRLQSVSPGLNQKETIEQSSAFVFSKGKVLTYNEEVACRIVSKLGKDFTGAVQAKPLLELLRSLNADDVEITTEAGELLVKAGRDKAGIRMEEEVLLNVSAVEEPGEWKVLPEDFAEASKIVSACASRKEDNRFDLTCVHFHPDYMEGAERFQVARYKISTGISQEFLVKHETMKHLTMLGVTQFSETEAWVHFKNTQGLVLSSRRYVMDFQDLTKFLQVKGEPVTIPGGLEEATKIANIFSSQNTDDNKVMVKLSPGRMRLRGDGMTGWYERSLKVKYSGPLMEFLIKPELLIELCKNHKECTVSSGSDNQGGRLKVSGERYEYVACLSRVEKRKEEQPEPEEAGVEV